MKKIAKDADIPKTTAKVAFDSTLDGIKKASKKGTARPPSLDLGLFEIFIGRPGWVAIPKPVKR